MQVCNSLRCCTLTNIARCQETYKTENTFTLTRICKNKRHSTMRQSLKHTTFVSPYMPTEPLRRATKLLAIRLNTNCISTTKYWLCAIFCGVHAITDKYSYRAQQELFIDIWINS